VDLATEKRQMQKTLTEALDQLHSTKEEDVIDRTLGTSPSSPLSH